MGIRGLETIAQMKALTGGRLEFTAAGYEKPSHFLAEEGVKGFSV